MSNRVQELYESKIRKVVMAYERGEEISSIAEQIGVSPPTIAKWLSKEGYKRKKKGRVPLAMKARVRDLHLRGWPSHRISEFLGLDPAQVSEWSSPIGNPILGGEKDPLKVKGQKKLKKDKRKGGSKKPEKEGKWPPDKHRCRKHWKPLEKAYVLELIEKGIKPGAIYRRMRASRDRQAKIWRESGGKGMPPNFPPPRGPFAPSSPAGPLKVATSKQKQLGDAELAALEAASATRQARMLELRAQAEAEKKEIRRLELEQKMLLAERVEKEERLASAQKAMESRRVPAKGKRRVLPGSYEQEVLGLKPGSIVDPGKPGRPSLGIPDSLGEYADNGKYFTVSNDWIDLEDAKQDELELVAALLTAKGFPSRVEAGDQPKSFTESTWPKKIESKWINATNSAISTLEKYQDRKADLSSKKMYTKGIAKYLANAHDAYDDSLSGAKKDEAQDEMLDNWARLKLADRYILIFNMKMANRDGSPTPKGIAAGRNAKIHLKKDARARAAQSPEAIEKEKRRRQRMAEKASVDEILGKVKQVDREDRKALGSAEKDAVDEILGKK